MDWRVAHYDTVYFEGRAEHVESADIHVLRFSKCGNRYSLYCNDEPVFENLTLPAVKPGLIGFAFKKENTALERFELAKLHLK
ncbi:MAG: hypothetical protein U5N86_13440 [Planctomycetota bacterium]|nr:hypothetical protein [Planctomycetota bacterium]